MTSFRAPGRPPRSAGLDAHSALLRAGGLVFALGGASRGSVRAVAAVAGLSPAALYARFGSRAGLLDAVLAECGPGVVIGACDRLHGADDLPAFVAAVWEAWARPLPRAAFALYLHRTGALPDRVRGCADLEPGLRGPAEAALRVLTRRVARWPGLPAPPAEVAWVLVEGLLRLRAAPLSDLEGTLQSQTHARAVQAWVTGGERPC
ncbi:TetR/AcrR family transcriptional regulator [Deinococcus sedimenti]|uniref:HTH tetR-type domain-containing protein n=1 Tax=Deinococcus sedimenti TaxID=1867090 RepID=A0ABQ2S0N5_9DEIO|nr:TetR/AcrR family transcriptional regulator [Deinococcus sedimenti]GGR82609.1 hypothetical protein GCM10008960_07030 [Deinococcus sedimenti]